MWVKILSVAALLCCSLVAAADVAPPSYLQHKALFEDSIEQVGDTPVWSLIDHGVNVIVVEGDDGLVLIDAGLHRVYAEKALAKLRTISDKPIVALVYTHHHVDHINGAGFFVDPKAVERGEIPVIAAANLMAEMADENVMTAPIMALRSSYMFGFGLQGEEQRANYVGCCGDLPSDTNTAHETLFIPPTIGVESEQRLTLAGIEFRFFRTGGEAASQMVAWLPEYRVLLSGDEVQGPTFPNLHSMRGTKMRDADAWVDALDRMRVLQPEHMVPGHGKPVSGQAEVQRILTHYRDAIQYAHDQSIRYINKGYTQEQLGEQLAELPDYLRLEPWTGEHYGNLPTAARSYFVGYISWFSGDAVDLAPTPRDIYGQRLVELMGGRQPVLDAARDALQGAQLPEQQSQPLSLHPSQRRDIQFAAELASLLIHRDPDDQAARQVKADAFRRLGYAETNTNWRNFYLMGAMELEGRLDAERMMLQLNNPANLARLPGAVLVDSLRYRIAAERARDQHIRLQLSLTDTGQEFGVELRNSVIQIHPAGLADAAAVLRLDRAGLGKLMTGHQSLEELLKTRQVTLRGDRAAAERFFALLDTDVVPRSLVVR